MKRQVRELKHAWQVGCRVMNRVALGWGTNARKGLGMSSWICQSFAIVLCTLLRMVFCLAAFGTRGVIEFYINTTLAPRFTRLT